MRVIRLMRFPVKSMRGEAVDAVYVGPDGLDGDRRWSLVDAASGAALTGRGDPRLLFASAAASPDGSVRVVLPDGSVATDDAALSAWVGRPVRLLRSADGAPAHDTAGFRVSLVGLPALGGWDERRFRTNVLVDDGLGVHGTVRIGDAVLKVAAPIERCVMVTRPQAGGVERDLGVLRVIHRERGGTLAVGAAVLRPGLVRVGDEVLALPG